MAKRRSTKKRTNNYLILLIVFGVIVIGAVGASFLLQAPETDVSASLPLEVSVEEAYAMQEAGALILDVRNPDEWVQGHVPGASLIPLPELESNLSNLPKDQEIVVICRSGNRSAQARDILLSAGYETVTSVAGGMNDWAAANLPVELGP